MLPKRIRDFRLDLWAIVILLPCLLIPFLEVSPFISSVTHQVLVAVTATFGVYVMLRMNLLPFTVPTFMLIGGYAAAIAAKAGATNVLISIAVAFIAPVIFALPLGLIILRLKGVYFIFFTFILNEIMQVIVFETPGITGGSDGIAGVPSATLFGFNFASGNFMLMVTIVTAVIAALITLAVTHRYRAAFSAIEENETLAESLGLAIWRYRLIGFVTSAGLSGLAGYSLVHMLSTAHPSSFDSFTAIDYVAYAIVGGKTSMLGAVIGAGILVSISNIFSAQGLFSAALFGTFLMVTVMVAPNGFVGLVRSAFEKRRKSTAIAPLPPRADSQTETQA